MYGYHSKEKRFNNIKKNGEVNEMTINEVKLMIYESSLNPNDKNICIQAIESCKSRNELETVINECVDVLKYTESCDDFNKSVALSTTSNFLSTLSVAGTIGYIIQNSQCKSIIKEYKKCQDNIENLKIRLASADTPGQRDSIREDLIDQRMQMKHLESEFDKFLTRKHITKRITIASIIGSVIAHDGSLKYMRAYENDLMRFNSL